MTTEDSKIIRMIQARNEKGLGQLYDRYNKPLFGIIHRIIYDKRTAEEILQQTLMKAWTKIEQYDPEAGTLFTWLSVIARNTSIDKRRLKSYEKTLRTDSLDAGTYDSASTGGYESRMDAARLLGRLDNKYKVVLDKMYLCGFSQSDIAKELDIPLGTVKTRIRTAIRILRDELKNEKSLFLGVILIVFLILKMSL